MKKEGYLKILYERVCKNRQIFLHSFDDMKIKQLPTAVFKGDLILHLHWIEHLYTLGVSGRMRSIYLRFLVMITVPFCLCFLAIARRVLKGKIAFTVHNVVPHNIYCWRMEYIAFRKTLEYAGIVFVHNEYTKTRLSRLYGVNERKLRLVPHGSWLEAYPNEISKQRARDILGIQRTRFVLCYFGHIAPYKGLDLLIDAITGLDEQSSILTVIVGPPTDANYFQKLVNKIKSNHDPIDVKLFPCYVPRKSVQLFMNACDVGVIPYHRITTPGSLILFLSFGKPVIVPALPPIMEVAGKKACFYFKPRDSSSLRLTIMNAVNNKQKSEKMGELAQRRAKTLDWERNVAVTYNSYLELLEGVEN